MIKVKFFHSKNDSPSGFEISGHAGFASHGNDIVCSAVSSAAYMAANTIIEIMGIDAMADVSDGRMKILVPPESTDKSKDTLLGLELHLKELSRQYPNNVTITITEV
ncbi:MAG: ribosomal-processing cysteine protease Prp [Ruminococcaceae bacterium]|nr:ribosomal-processing cysteine protease Prp [Oscillospiraceae bacterium]